MKTILVLAIILVLAGIGYAASVKRMEADGYRDAYWADVICLEGYKFAVVKVSNNNGIAITQIFEKYTGTNPQPMKCN